MPRLRSCFLLAVFALLALSLAAGPKPQEPAPKYDPAAEIKIKGVVQEVKNYSCPVAGSLGAHLLVKTDAGVVEVHLGGVKFLTDYGFQFAAGDEVEMVGVMVKLDGKDAFLARTLTRGQTTFVFRDPKGRPLW